MSTACPAKSNLLFTPVHPRACGERSLQPVSRSWLVGSSPRLRGTAGADRYARLPWRFIPAPAGNGSNAFMLGSSPRLRGTGSAEVGVHPRACGERSLAFDGHVVLVGSSPRLRGTGSRAADNSTCIGSSPRLRGTGLSARCYRFIPAPVGNGRRSGCRKPTSTVHPRACGERVDQDVELVALGGSSPRLRGTVVTKL